jgi:hypothetical protein
MTGLDPVPTTHCWLSVGVARSPTKETHHERQTIAGRWRCDGGPGRYEIAECATVKLPLDYDQPRGATTDVAVLRIKARNQATRIGSLFVNPGRPGPLGH